MTSKEQQNQAQCHVISSPFRVTGSTQMFTTPKRPIPHARPLSEIGEWKIKQNIFNWLQVIEFNILLTEVNCQQIVQL